MTTYPVMCGCGAVWQVAASSAGARLACRCGANVAVPPLTELRAAAGLPTGSPELALGHLVLSKRLPLEADCVLCGRATDLVAKYHVVCEKPTLSRPAIPWWQWPLFLLHLPALIHVLPGANDGEAQGRDVAFTLPVRVCEWCMTTLTTHDAVRAALRRTPEYARLLDKYPRAGVRNAD